MPFFEGKQELYQLLCFLIIPMIICFIYYILKLKKIWVIPLICLVVFAITTATFYPYFFTDIINHVYDSTTIYWFILVLPLHIVASLCFTFITYLLMKFSTRRMEKYIEK
jgi:hypothetical protein